LGWIGKRAGSIARSASFPASCGWITIGDAGPIRLPGLAVVAEQLSLNAGLEAKTLLEALQRAHPGRFADGQLRTLQRQVKRWRGLEGPAKEVFFAQVHHPGRLCQSDFSHMTALGVDDWRRNLEHMVYHFVLTYSNWEAFRHPFATTDTDRER